MTRLAKRQEFKLNPGSARLNSLHRRLIEHNIRVISKAYTRILSARQAQVSFDFFFFKNLNLKQHLDTGIFQ